jgi:hypothetical protein
MWLGWVGNLVRTKGVNPLEMNSLSVALPKKPVPPAIKTTIALFRYRDEIR